MTPACGRVEVGEVAILLVPRSLEGWPDFERSGRGVVVPDASFRDDPRRDATVGVLTFHFKGY